MNESPEPTPQPAPQPSPAPIESPISTPTPVVTPQKPSSLATVSMILGIAAFALGILFFLSIPAAIVAIITGAIALKKNYPGKTKAIVGIVGGGIVLLFIPAATVIGFATLNNDDFDIQKILTGKSQSVVAPVESTGTASSTLVKGNKIDTDCYTYTIPTGYEIEKNSKGCVTAVNIPRGDALTRIIVKRNTGPTGTLEDVVATYNKSLRKDNPEAKGVLESEQFTSNGHTVYYVAVEDGYGYLFGYYMTLDASGKQSLDGQPVTAFTVAGYVYNSQLKALVRGVSDSLVIK